MAGGSKGVVYAAMGANAAIAAGKFGVGLATGSVARLAESAHSVADTINQIFLLVSINFGDNAADEDHPYGYGKERFFWSFLAALFIFAVGAGFSLYEGVEKLLATDQHHSGAFWPSYVVLGLAFVFEGGVLLFALREVRRRARTTGIGPLAYLRESSDMTLKTAIYEDAAALVGVALAATGLALVQATGNAFSDGLALVLLGLVLIYVAFMLGVEARGLLLGSAAPPRARRAIEQTIRSFPEVRAIVTVLTMQLGPDSILVTGGGNVRDGLTTDEIEHLLERLAASIRAAVSEVKNIYLEPHSEHRGRVAVASGAA